MTIVMLSSGEYSSYSWLAVLDVGDLDLDALRKDFMDTYFPTFSEPLPQSYDNSGIWERCKAYDNAQIEAFRALGYTKVWNKDAGFVEWLVKEQSCKEIGIQEFNLDNDLQSWKEGRVNTYGY